MLTAPLVEKKTDHVRTPEGAAHYHLPIGAPILAHQGIARFPLPADLPRPTAATRVSATVYRPHHWAKITHEDNEAPLLAQELGIAQKRPDWSRDQVLAFAQGILDDFKAKHGGLPTLYVNGPHRVRVYPGMEDKVTKQQVQEVFRMIDAMQTGPFACPTPVAIAIAPQHIVDGMTRGRPNVLACTIRGTGYMTIGPIPFDESNPANESHGHYMPARDGGSMLQYTFAHEWGHVIERDDHPRTPVRTEFHEIAKEMPGSGYSHTTPTEGFAEAFADWYLSDGNPTSMFTRMYARFWGWPKP
jgi:hypothetical protein